MLAHHVALHGGGLATFLCKTKLELKEASKLKAEASVDLTRAKGLTTRESELAGYAQDKQKFADAAAAIARKADAEYAAEEDQVSQMDGDEPAQGQRSTSAKSDAALRQRLQRHLPLLRVVNKLAQRVGAIKDRGRNPRFLRRSRVHS